MCEERKPMTDSELLAAWLASGHKVTHCIVGERGNAPGEAPTLDEDFDGESE
jgi:hypothetical protein